MLISFLSNTGGTAGSLLASRLANTLPGHQILLVEAGGRNNSIDYQIIGERYLTFKTAEGYNWGYRTVPQSELNGREVDYSRGKGLGGSSAINFCVYTRGAEADYNRWAELVNDPSWNWLNVQERFQEVFIILSTDAASLFDSQTLAFCGQVLIGIMLARDLSLSGREI